MKSTSSQRWILLVTVAAGLLLITLDNSVLYTALPTLTRELGATGLQGLWIINAYPLVMAGLLLGSGTLGDRFGHRRLLLIGLVLFGIASLAAAFAPNAAVLIGARALLAVGAAAMMPATLALVRITFEDERERSLAIAVWGCMSIVGAALGPIVGGALLERFWWGSVFLLNIPVVVLAFISAFIVAPGTESDSSKPWDLISSLQVLVALSGLVFAIKEFAKAPPSWFVAGSALALSIVAGAFFARRQARLRYPSLDFSIFRNPAFLSGVLAAAAALFTIAGIQLVMTQRFQLIAGFSPLRAGLLVSAIAVGCLPSALLGGAFLHKIGLRLLIGGGLTIGVIGVVTTTFGLYAGMGWTVAGLLLTGFGLGAAMSVASTAIVSNVPVHRAGMASSVEEVSYEFGSLFAVSLLGSLLAALYSAGVILPDGAPEAARENVVATVSLAHRDGNFDAAIMEAASVAFDHGYVVVMVVIAVVLAIFAIATTLLLRHYGPGTQSSSQGGH